ncbi:YdeI family protein [Dyadobacter sp. CY312]|uniref:YdeI/OmpD-associated family protein n=1 Tax=Dyadobacter sp. CY312 TaxID=2907303 RepID=UPI001F165E6B|nr:YdeI/OmpD-associated family protein [Dyadobacter sp. CY312]MCE7042841.1 YdeI/OmpD-associated family protein [Dyadobacter sp. CY312]
MQNDIVWSEELRVVANILNKAPLEKAIKWGAQVFTYEGRNVVSYGGFKNYFTIWFYNGVFLKDPYQVLVNAQEGKTKSLRQWRFGSMAEVDENRILEYVLEAIEIEKQGLKIIPEKFAPMPLPAILEDELQRGASLRAAYKNLTPGKQKEYCIYIQEAKQENTKAKRVQKIKPMILQGLGLNDKYK